jgi:hypothetical protein
MLNDVYLNVLVGDDFANVLQPRHRKVDAAADCSMPFRLTAFARNGARVAISNNQMLTSTVQ